MSDRSIKLYLEDIKEAIRKKEIIGTRSKVIHEYFGIDETILWKTITADLPQLKKQIEKIRD